VLGQACGLPYIQHLSDKVSLIGAIDLGLSGCAPGQYNSHIIVRATSGLALDDLAQMRYAYNTPCSQSGLGSLQKMGLARGRGFQTGSHRASIQLVAEGGAEYAAIDAQSWKLALKYEPAHAALRILISSVPTPAPAFIARLGADIEAYRRALDVMPMTPADYASLL